MSELSKHYFFFSFNQKVDGSVIKMRKNLYRAKRLTQDQDISRADVQATADAILHPLMNFICGTNEYLKISLIYFFILYFPPF